MNKVKQNMAKQQIKRIFEIPHFFNRDGKLVRNVLCIEEFSPYLDDNGFVREGKITLRLIDEDGSSKAFRLRISEVLELIQVLELASRRQLEKLRVLNIERMANLRSREEKVSEKSN